MATKDISTGLNLESLGIYKRLPLTYESSTFNRHDLNAEHIDYPDLQYGNFTYSINGDNIISNFQSGVIEIAYKRLVTDDETGLPLILDDAETIKAIKMRLIANASRVLWYSGKLTRDIYADAENKAIFAIESAQSNLHNNQMLNADYREMVSNTLSRLIPNRTAQRKFYRDLGSREIYKNH